MFDDSKKFKVISDIFFLSFRSFLISNIWILIDKTINFRPKTFRSSFFFRSKFSLIQYYHLKSFDLILCVSCTIPAQNRLSKLCWILQRPCQTPTDDLFTFILWNECNFILNDIVLHEINYPLLILFVLHTVFFFVSFVAEYFEKDCFGCRKKHHQMNFMLRR